jgi:hypothetical protein
MPPSSTILHLPLSVRTSERVRTWAALHWLAGGVAAEIMSVSSTSSIAGLKCSRARVYKSQLVSQSLQSKHAKRVPLLRLRLFVQGRHWLAPPPIEGRKSMTSLPMVAPLKLNV